MVAHGVDHSDRPPDPSAIEVIFHTSCAEGEPPLAVFFDATPTKGLTDNDYVNSMFTWKFNGTNTSPNSTNNAATGFLAAHVFREVGTYEVHCEVIDKTGRRGDATGRVVIRAFNGNTYFVAADGSDANQGTHHNPLRTVKFALEHKAAPDTRILFRRGDTFDFGHVDCRGKEGPVLVGAYNGHGLPSRPRPILRAHTTSGATFALAGTRDWRMEDLHVVNAESKQSTAFDGGGGASHLQFLNLRVEGFNIGFYLGRPPTTTNGFFVFGCDLHEMASYGVFGMANRFAFVSSRIQDQGANGHGIRVASGQKTLVRNSRFTSRHRAFTSITLRGKGNETANSQAVITGNSFDRTAQSGPQNTGYSEQVSDVLWEKNRFIDGSPVHGSTGLIITAKRVTVRHNLFFNINTAVNLRQQSGVGNDDIQIHHNTQCVTVRNDQGHFFLKGAGRRVKCHHNIYVSDATTPWSRVIAFTGELTELDADHNHFFAPGHPTGWNPFRAKGIDYSLVQWRHLGKGLHTQHHNPNFLTTDPNHTDFLSLPHDSPAQESGAILVTDEYPDHASRFRRCTSQAQ